MRPLSLTPLVALLALLLVAPAGGAAPEPADVTITIEAPAKLLSSHEPFTWTVTLTWDEAQALADAPTALDLLDHAVAQHESTYTLSWFDLDGDGTTETAFVDEVNGVSSDFTLLLAGYFWALYEDGESATTGINHIALAPGKTIDLVYTGFPVDA